MIKEFIIGAFDHSGKNIFVEFIYAFARYSAVKIFHRRLYKSTAQVSYYIVLN